MEHRRIERVILGVLVAARKDEKAITDDAAEGVIQVVTEAYPDLADSIFWRHMASRVVELDLVIDSDDVYDMLDCLIGYELDSGTSAIAAGETVEEAYERYLEPLR